LHHHQERFPSLHGRSNRASAAVSSVLSLSPSLGFTDAVTNGWYLALQTIA
jgi:Na+-translocating ferredoxin:NAD+ oxidoreductase RnfE subunit